MPSHDFSVFIPWNLGHLLSIDMLSNITTDMSFGLHISIYGLPTYEAIVDVLVCYFAIICLVV
jgi:hypothetical protein